ncbi:glutamate-rich WD repeat-containing protein 1 [Tanacetum coccineum]
MLPFRCDPILGVLQFAQGRNEYKVQKGHYEDLIETWGKTHSRPETGEFKTQKNLKRYLDMKSMQDQVRAGVIPYKTDQDILDEVVSSTNRQNMSRKGRKLPGGGSTSRRRGPQPFPDVISREEMDRILRQRDQEAELLRKQTAEAQQRAYLAALKADAAYQNSETMYGAIDRWTRWHNLRLQRGQTVQEYTTNFRRLAVTLGISTNNEDVFTKYVAGLPQQIQTEMRLHTTKNISEASSIAMAIELKNKSSGQKFQEGSKGEGSSRGDSKKDFRKTVSMQSANGNKYCSNCKITGHTEESCWKVHPELFPKKWIKDDRGGKRTTNTALVNDIVELESVQEADKSLSLMTKQKEKASVTKDHPDEKEELFTLNIQVKQEVIEAIVDTGSQKNLISASLV